MDDDEIRLIVLSEIAAMQSAGLLSSESIYWSSFRRMCSLEKNTLEYFAAIDFHSRVAAIYEQCMNKHLVEKMVPLFTS